VIVIAHSVHKQTPEQIAEDYRISLAVVHAALAYYYQHQAEMDALMAEQERLADDYKEKRVGSRHKPNSLGDCCNACSNCTM
jgi:hypothetical protein